MLTIEDLYFCYNKKEILTNINFSAKYGELLAILGPNGVGKTSLLKCINGIHKAQKGSVLIENKNLIQMSMRDIAHSIAYVPQTIETAKLTVFDTILMGRRPHIKWAVSKRDVMMVQAVLEKLEFAHYSLQYIDQLSGGELQKTALARALVQEPKLLLLDEPIAALDLKNQIHTLALIRNIVDEHHITAVMTMHDINGALRYADRCCFIKNGTIYTLCKSKEVNEEIIEEVYGVSVSIHYIDSIPVVIPKNSEEI